MLSSSSAEQSDMISQRLRLRHVKRCLGVFFMDSSEFSRLGMLSDSSKVVLLASLRLIAGANLDAASKARLIKAETLPHWAARAYFPFLLGGVVDDFWRKLGTPQILQIVRRRLRLHCLFCADWPVCDMMRNVLLAWLFIQLHPSCFIYPVCTELKKKP